MTGFGGNLGEGKAGTQRRKGTRAGRTPQGLTGIWVHSEGGKGGARTGAVTAADSGTRQWSRDNWRRLAGSG